MKTFFTILSNAIRFLILGSIGFIVFILCLFMAPFIKTTDTDKITIKMRKIHKKLNNN